MSEPKYLGSNLVTFGNGRTQLTTTWGDRVTVVDPPVVLSEVGSLLGTGTTPKKLWRTQPSLRKVVGFGAEKTSAVPMHVYLRIDENDRKRDSNGPAEKLLRKPRPFITGSRLFHDLMVDWMMYDRWLIWLVDNQLLRIPPGLIDVEVDFLGGITALKIQTENGKEDITGEHVAFDAGWSIDSGKGISPLDTLAQVLEEQARSTKWRANQWKNSAKLTGTLNSEANLPDKTKARIIESWRAYRDTNAGGTPILDNGIKFTPIDFKPTATDDLEGRRLSDAEVASFYHIPPELVGARDGTFSNIKAFRQMLYGPTLGPKMKRIEDAFNLDIIPYLSGETAYGEFAREAAMAGSFEEQATVFQKAAGGPHMTRNEVRARQNLPRIEGADELIVPANVIVGGLASPADTAPNSVEEGGDGED